MAKERKKRQPKETPEDRAAHREWMQARQILMPLVPDPSWLNHHHLRESYAGSGCYRADLPSGACISVSFGVFGDGSPMLLFDGNPEALVRAAESQLRDAKRWRDHMNGLTPV